MTDSPSSNTVRITIIIFQRTSIPNTLIENYFWLDGSQTLLKDRHGALTRSYLSSWWLSSPSLNSSSSTKCPNGSEEMDTMLERMRRLSLLAVSTSWSWLWL